MSPILFINNKLLHYKQLYTSDYYLVVDSQKHDLKNLNKIYNIQNNEGIIIIKCDRLLFTSHYLKEQSHEIYLFV